MVDNSDNDGPRRPVTRPFVSGRVVAREAEPQTFSYAPARPFSFAGSRERRPATSTSSTSIARPRTSPTPLWTVAVYEPGLEHVNDSAQPRPRTPRSLEDDVVEASLALADDVLEAQRHASSLAAADVLEVVARRLRRGEILLLAGASTKNEAAVVSSVLAALLGGRR